jgi:hypothetical protein
MQRRYSSSHTRVWAILIPMAPWFCSGCGACLAHGASFGPATYEEGVAEVEHVINDLGCERIEARLGTCEGEDLLFTSWGTGFTGEIRYYEESSHRFVASFAFTDL